MDTQSSDISAVENRVREVIPVTDRLGKETTFIGLYTSRWKLKCLGVTISIVQRLVFGIRSSVGILALPLQYKSIIRPPFLERLMDVEVLWSNFDKKKKKKKKKKNGKDGTGGIRTKQGRF